MINSIANLRDPATAAPAQQKTKDAARQFEALLIGELLKSSREAGGAGWLGTGEQDQAGQLGLEVAEQEFAKMLAAKGGLGLARMVERFVK
jgi:Rod binding domain-containing protein